MRNVKRWITRTPEMQYALRDILPSRKAVIYGICMAVSAVLAFAPEYDGLSGAGRRGLYILLSSAGLWITEAIPPFAVGLQLIGLAIALLGRPGGVFASGPDDWEIFSASAAMCLPVSTPPNALAFGSGLLDSRDFLPIGLIFGAVAPAASVLWSGFVLG